jgi:hypothetical protein
VVGGGDEYTTLHIWEFEGETATEELCEEIVEDHVVRGNYARRM